VSGDGRTHAITRFSDLFGARQPDFCAHETTIGKCKRGNTRERSRHAREEMVSFYGADIALRRSSWQVHRCATSAPTSRSTGPITRPSELARS